MNLENSILKLIEDKDNITYSDIQGIVQAMVLKHNNVIIKELQRISSEVETDRYTIENIQALITKIKKS